MTPKDDFGLEDQTHAGRVRQYCAETYIEPARRKKEYEVSIRTGDVHTALKFTNRLLLICSAIGANIFETESRIKRIAVDGPLNGANTLFVFRIL
jgi:hypothetical protein